MRCAQCGGAPLSSCWRRVNTDKMGKSALLQAAEKGREEIVRLLLKNKANLDTKDKEGRTPLMCAALTGSTSVVALLLEHGVPVDATDKVRAARRP